jgi:hypothetical protein
MSHAPKTTLRMAAVFTGFALSAGIAVPAFAAAPAVARAAAPSVFVAADAAPSTVVSRLSVATGAQEGGNKILVSGTGLATVDADDPTKFVAKSVEFGTIDPKTKIFTATGTVADDKVEALSTGALEVTVPAAAAADGTKAAQLKVVVLVGDAKVGPAYTYVQAAPTTSAVTATGYSSDTGSTGSTVTGEGFEATATGNQVVVGGKPAKVTKVEVAGAGADKLTFSAPAGLVGVQDVVVTTKAGSAYAGYVTFEATTPTFSTDVKSGLTTQPTTVAVTGANLGLVKTAGFQFTTGGKTVTVPVAVTPVKSADGKSVTGLKLVVPKWDAKYIAFGADDKGIEGHIVLGTSVVTTTGGDGDKFEWKIPVQSTVTDVTQAADAKVTTSTKYTLTGTDLTGLVNVVITPQAGVLAKAVTVPATAVTVVDGTTASFTLPTLPAGTYDVVVKTQAAKNSDTYELTSAGLPTKLTKATYAEGVTTPKVVPTTVTLTGANFNSTLKARIYAVGTTAEDLEDVKTLDVKATSLTAASFTLDANLGAGDYVVELSRDGGTTWDATTPAVTIKLAQSLTKVGYTGSTGVVTLTGTGLTKATTARVYKSDATDTAIAALTPVALTTATGTAGTFTAAKDLAVGEYSVQVSLDGKTWSTATTFKIVAPLKVTSATYADKKVTLAGDSLATATTVKLFKGTFASSTLVTGTYAPTTGVFTVPTALADGEYFISVQAGTGPTLSTTFTVGE